MISTFIKGLKDKPTEELFNPWFEQDPFHDAVPKAYLIRRRQLERYLSERKHAAKYLMIAEALGYQGGHFTGIAMTSERILLGHQKRKYGVQPHHVFKTVDPVRTSTQKVSEKGMTEPTATIMWGSLIEAGLNPYEVVLWNAVPWHPYDKRKGLLSNRTPTASELSAGLDHLNKFIALFSGVQLVAVGKKCEQSLNYLGKSFSAVRHPANGGAPKFRSQLKLLYLNRFVNKNDK